MSRSRMAVSDIAVPDARKNGLLAVLFGTRQNVARARAFLTSVLANAAIPPARDRPSRTASSLDLRDCNDRAAIRLRLLLDPVVHFSNQELLFIIPVARANGAASSAER